MKLIQAVFLALVVFSCTPVEEEKKDEEKSDASSTEDPLDDGEGTEGTTEEPGKENTGSGSGTTSESGYTYPNEAATWSGENDQVVNDLAFKKGALVIEVLNTSATSNFIVSLNDSNGETVAIVTNKIGNHEGASVEEIPEDGTYSFDVQSDGEWTISVRVPESSEGFPATVSGSIPTVYSKAARFKSDTTYTVAASHEGDGNFVVSLIHANTGKLGELTFNEIGSYNGENQVTSLDYGYYFIEVEANGAWSLGITEGSSATSCCKVCSTSIPCGDSCISASNSCSKDPGCACAGTALNLRDAVMSDIPIE
jgi:hypothetical protein